MSHHMGLDLNEEPGNEESDKKRPRSIRGNWSKEESVSLFEVMENLSTQELRMRNDDKWVLVSERLRGREIMKTAPDCERKHKNTLQKFREIHPASASSTVSFTQLKEFMQKDSTSTQSSPVERTISLTYEGSTKRIKITACSDVVAAATVRSIFGLEDTQGFWLENDSEVVYEINRFLPPGNYGLRVAKSVRSITVSYEGSTESIHINGCSEVISAAIKSAFGLEDTQKFLLKHESGIVCGVDRNMPLGQYNLQLAKSDKGISVTFQGCTKRININASSEVIAATIRSLFGFEDTQGFWLENEAGVVFAIDRGMPVGEYTCQVRTRACR